MGSLAPVMMEEAHHQKPSSTLVQLCIDKISATIHTPEGHKRLGRTELTGDVKSLIFNHEFSRCTVTDDVAELFVEVDQPNICLNECTRIGDATLRWLSSHAGSTLKTLSLVECSRITDGGLRSLSEGARGITKLDLTGCFAVSRFGLDPIARYCTSLTELDLTECLSVDDSAVYFLMQSKSLNILTLADCYAVRFLFEGVVGFVKQRAYSHTMKSLCLRHTRVTDDSVQLITELCPDLRILDLSWCSEITNRTAEIIGDKRYPNMFALNLWGCSSLTDAGLTHVCRNTPKLSSLTLSECSGLTDQSVISVIAMATNINSLNLWGCNTLSPASIQLLLRHSPGMMSLGLSFCTQVNDAALDGLSEKVVNIKGLQFESCHNLTDKTVRSLGSKSLTNINFRRCSSLTSSGIWECLQRCETLTSLNLAFCRLDLDFVENLWNFSCLAQLRLLDLSGFRQLTDQKLQRILDNEGFCQNVVTFKLDECTGVSDVGIDALLRRCNNLQNISLCFCRELTDQSFATLEEGRHFSLQSVSVGGCGKFTDLLLRRLSHCPKLREMILAWNKQVTDKEIPNLSVRCQNLKIVNLSYCNLITDVGIKAIVENCRNIKRLDAGFCPQITFAGFLTASCRSKNLLFLRLTGTCLGSVEQFFIQSMKKNCPHIKIEIVRQS